MVLPFHQERRLAALRSKRLSVIVPLDESIGRLSTQIRFAIFRN